MVLTDCNSGFVLPVGYAGGLADPVSDLVRFGVRDYEPVSGRFTGPDPLLLSAGSANLYDFVGNEPIDHVDFAGQFKLNASAFAGLGGGIGLTITGSGMQVCLEGGVGAGGGIGAEPLANLAPGGLSAVLGVGVGPIGDGIQVPFDDCWASSRPRFFWDGTAVDKNASQGILKAAKYNAHPIHAYRSPAQRVLRHIDASLKVEASLNVCGCTSPLYW